MLPFTRPVAVATLADWSAATVSEIGSRNLETVPQRFGELAGRLANDPVHCAEI
jgi:hypothetical protein